MSQDNDKFFSHFDDRWIELMAAEVDLIFLICVYIKNKYDKILINFYLKFL